MYFIRVQPRSSCKETYILFYCACSRITTHTKNKLTTCNSMINFACPTGWEWSSNRQQQRQQWRRQQKLIDAAFTDMVMTTTDLLWWYTTVSDVKYSFLWRQICLEQETRQEQQKGRQRKRKEFMSRQKETKNFTLHDTTAQTHIHHHMHTYYIHKLSNVCLGI